ncbi:Ribosome-binding factor A [Planctopirus ephydatiae]|uniref:Ribosome-binding factor A n=1 Tax=Planctopirus ephydatiae TaxID=2528019 RepID=A0A518GS14_9PLAN|nr:30S ribosome-binding factor RbfA [Planctopirus ephydatiae]QDV31383.1 Ribosome-binding factor A [Planctopirus ephydatiae]
MMSRRLAKASQAVLETVSLTIMRHIRDPRVKNVTVLSAEVAPDMRTARVHVSVMGTPKEQSLCMHGLQSACGFFQAKIADRLETRYTPVLTFVLDQGVKRSIETSIALREVLPTDEADSDEADSDEADSDEADSDEADSDEADSDEADSDEADSDEADSDEADSDEADSDEADSDEADSDEADSDEADSDEVDTDEADTDEAEEEGEDSLDDDLYDEEFEADEAEEAGELNEEASSSSAVDPVVTSEDLGRVSDGAAGDTDVSGESKSV